MVFPDVRALYIKKAEHQRIDTFERWCWRRLLRVPWTTRRSKQSILKEISPEYSLKVYGCESWTVQKAECRRTDAFELWCWRRRLRVPWTARRYNQSTLKEISPEYSLKGLMLKLKLQYLGHLIRKDPDAGKD